jgi:formylmethanofuran dehydrogenase subunit E
MDLARFVRCGSLLHGHPCPPLVLGIRAGAVAMAHLGVERATERELIAMVELGSDHYAQGFADGIQVVTGCTFGKDLIVRVPHGKLGVRLVDQSRRHAVRVVPRPEAIADLERTPWFRACADAGAFATTCAELSETAIAGLLERAEDVLFSVSAVFPMHIDDPPPSFATVTCDGCGESVLVSYAQAVGGSRLCVACQERRHAIARWLSPRGDPP